MITNKKHQAWRTPRALFERLDADYSFTIDGAASMSNHLLPRYMSRARSLLTARLPSERVFINPPFGLLFEFLSWARDARQETFSCMILPANVETDWFHDLAVEGDKHLFKRRVCYDPPPQSIRLVDGFWIRDPVKESQPSFASMLCMFGPGVKPSGLGFSAVRDAKTGWVLL